MANKAKIVFTATGSLDSFTPNDFFAFKFNGVDIVCQGITGVNDANAIPYPKFNIGANGRFSQLIDNLLLVIATRYQIGLNQKFSASYSLPSLSVTFTADNYSSVFQSTSDPNQTDLFYPIGGDITPEVLPQIFHITDDSITTGQNSVDKNEYCTYYISEQYGTSPCTLQNIPAMATNVRFQYGSVVAFEYFRQHSRPTITLKDANNVLTDNSIQLKRLKKWAIQNVQLTQNTATIIAVGVGLWDVESTLTYSVNGSNFQASNQFTNLPLGTHTAYILDNYGGLWTKSFEVIDLTNKVDAFFDVSDVNSLQFFDSSQRDNYLSSFEYQKKINIEDKCFYQRMKSNKIITTQFRSSYDNHAVSIDEIDIPVILVKKNIGLNDWRDCQFADGGNNKTLVYFPQGQIYDPETGWVMSNYDNNTVAGLVLDSWQVEGVVMSFTFGTYVCSSIVYDLNIQGMAMAINTPFLSFQPEICKSLYNTEDWDVFEFNIDMGLLLQKELLAVSLVATDDAYPSVEWISEPFVVDNSLELIEVNYSGEQAISDIVSTGLIHTIYLEATFYKYEPQTDLESFDDDKGNSITIKRSSQRIITLETHAIPPYLVNKLALAMLFKNIYIDGLRFSPIGEIKSTPFSDKNNPFCVASQQFTPFGKSINSLTDSATTQRVLGVSNQTILGV